MWTWAGGCWVASSINKPCAVGICRSSECTGWLQSESAIPLHATDGSAHTNGRKHYGLCSGLLILFKVRFPWRCLSPSWCPKWTQALGAHRNIWECLPGRRELEENEFNFCSVFLFALCRLDTPNRCIKPDTKSLCQYNMSNHQGHVSTSPCPFSRSGSKNACSSIFIWPDSNTCAAQLILHDQ